MRLNGPRVKLSRALGRALTPRAALVMRMPEREEVPVVCETQTVVEFYSR